METSKKNSVNSVIKKICLKHIKTAMSIFIKQKKQGIVVIVFVIVAIIVGVYLWDKKDMALPIASSKHKAAFDEKSVNGSEQLAQQLNDVAVKMANIEHHLSKDPLVYIEKVQSDLSSLKQETEQLASDSRQIISNQIQQSTADLVQHITAINSRLEKLEEEKKQAVYLTPSSLPFQIQHIDNIQQQNVVTVYYDNNTFPLDVGDYLADWKLISADFIRQKAEFMNSKQQHVAADLNHVNEQKG